MEKQRITLREKYRNLSLSNNFIFQKYMMNKDNCKKLLYDILGREVERIEYPAVERSMKENIDSKGIRLDVYFKGDDEVYNLEMQTSDEKNLDKRSRYYHSVIDIENIKEGSLYDELQNTYVIFICTFDPFGAGEYKYTFMTSCLENEDVKVDDGRRTIIFNTKGKKGNISDDLKVFLKAVEGVFDSTNYSATIKEEVNKIKAHALLEEEYMFEQLHELELKRKAEKEGMEKGELNLISKMLEKATPQQLIEMGIDEELIAKAQKEMAEQV